jgi:hypothetical protein
MDAWMITTTWVLMFLAISYAAGEFANRLAR